jgi:hypothetical protein
VITRRADPSRSIPTNKQSSITETRASVLRHPLSLLHVIGCWLIAGPFAVMTLQPHPRAVCNSTFSEPSRRSERARIAERVRLGMARARTQGKHLRRPRVQ